MSIILWAVPIRRAGRCTAVPRLGLLSMVGSLVLGLLAGGVGAQERPLRVNPVQEQFGGEPPYRTLWAVCIGVNRYQQANIPTLSFSVADAQAMRDLLVNQYSFPPENVTLLLNEEATKANILRALARLTDRNRVDARDAVLVYFSGHGQTVPLREGKMGFLTPYDAQIEVGDLENPAPYLMSCLPMSDLRKYAVACPAKHFLLLIDACFSGLVLTGRSALPARVPDWLRKVAAQPVTLALTAGGEGEVAWEKPEWGHGAFTRKLLDALQPREGTLLGDTDGDGLITSAELVGFLPSAVRQLTEGKQNPQHGREGEGEFLFIPAQAVQGTPANPLGISPQPATPTTPAVTRIDREAPQLRILAPPGAEPDATVEVEHGKVLVSGVAIDDVGVVEVRLDGRTLPTRALSAEEGARAMNVPQDWRGVRFEIEIPLAEGEKKEVEVAVRDQAGNTVVHRFIVSARPGAAPAQSAPLPASIPSGWQTYRHAETGLSFSHPSDWRVEENDEGVLVLPPGVRFDPENPTELYLIQAEETDPDTQADDPHRVQEFEENSEDFFTSLQRMGPPEAVRTGGQTGALVQWAAVTQTGTRMRMALFHLVLKGYLIQFVMLAPEGTFATREPVLRRMLTTFRGDGAQAPGVVNPLAPSTPAQPTASPTAGWQIYQHPLGFRFRYPPTWSIQQTAIGPLLLPPDQRMTEFGPAEMYFVSTEPAPGITRPDDPQLLQGIETGILMQAPTMQRVGRIERVQAGAMQGVLLTYEGRNEVTGAPVQAKLFLLLHQGHAVALNGVGDRQSIAAREQVLRTIFSTFSTAPQG